MVLTTCRIWLESMRQRDQFEDLYMAGRVLLKLIIKNSGKEGVKWAQIGNSCCYEYRNLWLS